MVTVTYDELRSIAQNGSGFEKVLSPELTVEYNGTAVKVIQRFPVDEILREDEKIGIVIAKDIAYAVARWLDIFRDLLAQVKTIVVRPADAVADFGLGAPDWKFTISTANAWNTLATLDYTREDLTAYNQKNEVQKRLILIRGFIVEDPDPVVKLFRVKRRNDYSAPVDIVAHRNVKGWVILRKRIVLAKDSITLEGYATATGDVYLVFGKFSVVVEPAKTGPFYIEDVEEQR